MQLVDDNPDPLAVRALLEWYLLAGVDEAVGDEPVDRLRPSPDPVGKDISLPVKPVSPVEDPAPDFNVASTVRSVRAATTLDELKSILEGYRGCPLATAATRLVFGDGNPQARVVLIGEGPGQEEDRQGLPFVGPSGQLLDRMLASIGLDRRSVFISNVVYWRPPENRAPTSSEIAACLPFVERMIEIIEPRVLLALGGPAASTLLGVQEGVGRLRSRWFTYQTPNMPRPVEATVLYHPAYLLRSPAQKRLAWRDLLAIKKRITAT
jgi:DNA polymerase